MDEKNNKQKQIATPDYFAEVEFLRCSPSCKKSDMHPAFLARLNYARHLAGIPFILNSAYRSRGWELFKGRAGTSSHVSGRAVDIRCISDRNRYIIVTALLQAGFTRIGVANTYIHADDDPTKTQQVIWSYY